MPFTFFYSQHWELEGGSRMFEKLVIEPDRERGGKGSEMVSNFWRGGFCFVLHGFKMMYPSQSLSY